MTAIRALPHGIPNLDFSLHGRGDNTGHTHVLGNFVALKTTQLSGNLIRIDLHLELGTLLHFEVIRLKYLRIVHNLRGTLESLYELGRALLKLSRQLVVKGLQFGHVEL